MDAMETIPSLTSGPSLVDFTQPRVGTELSQSVLNNPALGQDLKALLLLTK
jgi:hypothetical protein